jgi:hypothetical protein
MPITPFLAGQAFDPEAIENMSAAFVAACDALRLKVGDDPATRLSPRKLSNLHSAASAIPICFAN